MHEMDRKAKHSLCRLCLREKVELLDVFESKGIPGWTAADAITELLCIQVTAGDMYPHCVCIECMKKLEDFKVFKEQCECNKDLLDRAYARNRGVESNEENTEKNSRCNENKREFYLEEKDVEISIAEDPVHLNEGVNPIKTEIEDDYNDYSEVIERADHFSNPTKSGFRNQASTKEEDILCKNVLDSDHRIKEEPLDVADKSGSDGYFEEGMTRATDAEITPRVCYDPDSFKKKKASCHTPDNMLNDHSSWPKKGWRGPTGVRSLSGKEDTVEYEKEATGLTSSNAGVNTYGFDASSDELTHLEEVGEHNRVQTKEKSFTCGLCRRGYQSNDSFLKHKCSCKAKTAEEPLAHSLCTEERSADSNNHRDADENGFKCVECLKKFSTADCLKRHMLIHSGEKPFHCTECSKTFCQKSHLKTHMLTHSGKKEFNCIECNKSFSLKENFKRHMVTHTGEKPFACDQCSMTFSWRSSLNRHKLTHSGKMPFACNTCSRTFSQKTSLNRHMLTHSGITPFVCSQCSKSFSQKNSLLRHIKTH